MDEIKDTPTDRAALALLLRSFPQTTVSATAGSIGLLNETWSRMARLLASMTEDDFTALVKRMDEGLADAKSHRDQLVAGKDRRTLSSEDQTIAGWSRAIELLDLVVDWRWQTWSAAEIAAGRDPYQSEPGTASWTPPAGWVAPAKR